jgi:hypothetical protein
MQRTQVEPSPFMSPVTTKDNMTKGMEEYNDVKHNSVLLIFEELQKQLLCDRTCINGW